MSENITYIRADDRGLLYGDGLFTTLAVIKQQPQHWQQHWQRLEQGCQRLNIPIPEKSALEQQLSQICTTLQPCAAIKIIITRGSGGRGYRSPDNPTPNIIISQHPCPTHPNEFYQKGVKIRLCHTRLAQQPLLAGIKHLNRLENVLARSEWNTPDIAEGLLLDTQNNLIEGTMSNLFFVKDGVLCTPSLQQCGVAGIMRSLILAAAHAENLPYQIGYFGLNDLYEAQEVFLSNSLLRIWSVHTLLEEEKIVQQWEQQTLAKHLAQAIPT